MINCLMYFGADGINYNWEDTGYTNETTIAFNKALYKEAAACGFDNFHLGLYTAMSSIVGNPNALFGDETGRTAHTMLNYAASDFSYNMELLSVRRKKLWVRLRDFMQAYGS